MDTEKPININISRGSDYEEKYNEFKEYLIIIILIYKFKLLS